MGNKLETYYGFCVALTDDLDPLRLDALRERTERLIAAYRYDPNQFHVYFHLLTISRCEPTHFGISGIENRLARLDMQFKVNPKQVRAQTIRFYNDLVDEITAPGVLRVPSHSSLSYEISGSYFASHYNFRNELITFVARTLPIRHRKIKVTLTPTPTLEFGQRLRIEGEFTTKLDFRFQRPILLRPPESMAQQSSFRPPTLSEETQMDPVTTISVISSGLALVDKFVNLFRKLKTSSEQPNRVEAKQQADSMEIRKDGAVVQTINAKQLHLNQWDEIRFNALLSNAKSLWTQYNQIYGQLSSMSLDEQARISQRMDKMRQDLCRDLREMVDISEKVLGVPLEDHYTLRTICNE